jgi:hypothetical protein
LTFSFHKLQYSEKLSSCICLSTAESANKTVSSAYYIKVVIFAGGRFPTNNFNFNFDGDNLEIVSDIVYLGVNFSRTRSYLNTKKRINKTKRGIHFPLV